MFPETNLLCTEILLRTQGQEFPISEQMGIISFE